MKRKKFLALALAGVMTAATLTACTPLEDLYDWFFGGGSGNASHGSEKSLVKESVELEDELKAFLHLSETTASDRAKETLEEVAKGFDATWLTTNNGLNETARAALESITKSKLEVGQQLWVDVMEWPSSDGTTVTDPYRRLIYRDKYQSLLPGSDGLSHYCDLTNYSHLQSQLEWLHKNNAELYAGTFQNGEKTYAAMVVIF